MNNMRNNELITEELKQISLLMCYDRSKPLLEQPDSVMDRRLGITSNNAKALGMSDAEYTKAVFGGGHFENWDEHDILMAVEIGAMIIAPFTGPFAPVFLGVSIAAGIADAAVYYFKDDDPHSALIAAGLVFIPELKLLKYFKSSGWYIKKYGRKLTSELLEKVNKYRKGSDAVKAEMKFTKEELKFIKEAGEDIATKESQLILKQEIKATTKRGFIKLAKEKTLKGLVGLVYNTLKFLGKSTKFIGKLTLQLSGTYIAFDRLYLYLWGDDEDRQNSEFKEIADLVADFSTEIYKKLLGYYSGLINDVTDKDFEEYEVIVKNGHIQTGSEYMEMKKQVFKREQENLPGKKTTLEMVRTGKSELHYGDQGSTVKQIQQMLLYLGIDLGDKGADTFFGEDTKDAIEEFQTYPDEYGVDIIMLKSQDGIVGDETLKAIEKAVKNKKSVENKKDE